MSEDRPGRKPDSARDDGDRDDRPGTDGAAGPTAGTGQDGGVGPTEQTSADEGAAAPGETGERERSGLAQASTGSARRASDTETGDGEGDGARERPATDEPDTGAPGDGVEPSDGGDGPVQAVQAPPGAGTRDGEEDGDDVPEDVRSYDRFTKVDRASYDRVNEFLRDRTYVTAREWAIARLCADFRTATGVEMTKIGEHLPELVPFMTDTYSPQAVNQARSAFERKVRMAGATFLYGAMSGFFTADELDELMYEVTEVAKFLLEVEGVELTVEEELDAEDRISTVMREVRRASEELRYDEVACPHCGQGFRPDADED